MSESMLTASFIIVSGGLQDAYTYLCRGGVFANAQTGNIVLFSAYLFEGAWDHCLRYLIPVLSFMAGIFAAECIHRRFKHMEKVHWRQLIILAEIAVLFAVGFMPQSLNTVANSLVSFSCAMQLQTFRKVRGHAYASTMCIGDKVSCILRIQAGLSAHICLNTSPARSLYPFALLSAYRSAVQAPPVPCRM